MTRPSQFATLWELIRRSLRNPFLKPPVMLTTQDLNRAMDSLVADQSSERLSPFSHCSHNAFHGDVGLDWANSDVRAKAAVDYYDTSPEPTQPREKKPFEQFIRESTALLVKQHARKR
jgi:hypothetical protein